MGKKARTVTDERCIRDQRACCAKQCLLIDNGDLVPPWRQLEIPSYEIFFVVGIDENSFGARFDEWFEPVINQRPAVNWHETFWKHVGQGPETSTKTRSKKDGIEFHAANRSETC